MASSLPRPPLLVDDEALEVDSLRLPCPLFALRPAFELLPEDELLAELELLPELLPEPELLPPSFANAEAETNPSAAIVNMASVFFLRFSMIRLLW